MKITTILFLSCSLLIGCTTYPKNYTYSPTVTVGGDNNSGIVLPSPYSNRPQPVPAPPVYQQSNNYYDNSYAYNEDMPIYFDTPPNVHYIGSDGVWR